MAAPHSESMFAPLAVRDFRLLFLGMVVGQALSPLQFIAQIIWVQESASVDFRIILVGLIATTRGAGMLSFGLFGGALADRFDRRKLLIVTQSSALALNVVIGLVMLLGKADGLQLALFYALTFGAAALAAIDIPTRQALVPEILGRRLIAGGIALNAAGAQIAMPMAILASGFLIDGFGPGVTYLIGGVAQVVLIAALLAMRHRSTLTARRSDLAGSRRAFGDIREGLGFIARQPTILWVIVLLTAMSGLGFPAVANLGPTWITTIVGVPVRDLGLVAVSWGLGALIASVTLTRFALLERKGIAVAVGAIGFAMAFVVFSFPTVPAAVIGNFGLGLFMSTAQISAAALIQLLAPNELRGRVMSVLALNMAVAQLVTFPLAVLGQMISLELLFPILAWSLLAVTALILITQPDIWKARIAARDLDRDAPA